MIPVDDLKEYLNIKGSELDSFLNKIIDYTTEKLSAYCTRDLRYGVMYDVLSGNASAEIELIKYPIERISYIKFRDEANIPPGGGHSQFSVDLFNGSPVDDNIYLDKFYGRILLLKSFSMPVGNKNIEIKYYAGYTADSPDPDCETPNDLKSVCLMISAEFFLKSFQGEGRLGIKSRAKDVPDIRLTETFENEDYTVILNRYKRKN